MSRVSGAVSSDTRPAARAVASDEQAFDDVANLMRAARMLPVLPTDIEEQQNNRLDSDEERSQVRFWGLHGVVPEVLAGADGELYVFGLDEEDGHDLDTRDRDLITVGARLRTKPAAGAFHFEAESAIQTGDSRASSGGADTTDLDHDAYFYHAAAGYTFDAAGKPRLELVVDYASGDEDPTDDENNRFDTLYGARAFDFGPTGIYGALARSNLFSPGWSVTFAPVDGCQVRFRHRLASLASDKDAWTTSGLRDPAGLSGDDIGQQVDVRVRWDETPGGMQLEVGAAHLFAGDFVSDAPNATGQGDATYGYVATTFRF